MVKSKGKRKKKSKHNGVGVADVATKKAVKKTKRKYNVDQLLDKADEAMDQLDVEAARLFCERALQIDSDHPRTLEVLGNLLLEANETEKAKQCWGRSISLDPEHGSSKYLNLAQTMEGRPAIELFEKGIQILISERDSTENEISKINFDTKIASAYCSIAEVFMTDLCFEENAESHCKEAIEKALEHDPKSAECYQLYSSFLMSSSKPTESKKMLEKSLELWLQTSKKEENPTSDAAANLPPFPVRLASAKLLIEHQEYLTALKVLEQLLEEDDEEIELSYLSGSCHCCLHLDKLKENSEDNHENGEIVDHKRAAVEYFTASLKLMVKLGVSDEEIHADIIAMLKELGFTGTEKEFDLNHLKTVIKQEKSAMVAGMLKNSTTEPDSDVESLTASDQEFLNNYANSDSENEEMDTAACSSSGFSGDLEDNNEMME